jgi:F-type H+-transporting ATPase subunit b
MPQLDAATFPSQLFWLAVIFVALLILMAKIGLPRVREVLDARSAKIDGDLGVAAEARGRAESLLAEYERSLAAARSEAQSTIRSMIEQIAKEQTRREHELMAQLNVEARSAETRIATAKNAALANVRQIAVEAAQAATGRLVGNELATADVDAAVGQILVERR